MLYYECIYVYRLIFISIRNIGKVSGNEGQSQLRMKCVKLSKANE